ncbi:hypothetical protein AVEN_74857-1 [Araneus ventricosus]|uniref:Uncharacterized protein n=1 Tax=Araneus ventricosus TaxID=182803 RepID=A0A4Y2SAF7_ARAVE|nr:hypothetical protein AVEN_74857-1 [Araneus ventricosus]
MITVCHYVLELLSRQFGLTIASAISALYLPTDSLINRSPSYKNRHYSRWHLITHIRKERRTDNLIRKSIENLTTENGTMGFGHDMKHTELKWKQMKNVN